jgi:HEAT repeat protein
VEPLLAALRDEEVHRAATVALGELGESAVEPLLAALRDEDSDTRRAAAEALDWLSDLHVVESLLAASQTLNPDVTRQYDRVQYLALQLGSANWGAERRAAAGALGKLGDPHAVECLVLALRHKDRYVREAAAKALGKLGDARAVEPLLAALRGKDWLLREAAAEALRRIGTPDALEALATYEQ